MSRDSVGGRQITRVCAALCLLALASVAAADDGRDARFVLRVVGPVEDVLRAHGLEMVRTLKEPDLYLVAGRSGASVRELIKELTKDPAVASFERERRARIPEVSSPDLQQSTPAILDALEDRRGVSFGARRAWIGYVRQPMVSVIRLNRVREQGVGIVAVIDTGVDAGHPVLEGSVDPGYDFTRDLAGATSDSPDLDQSTAAILDQSTAAILDQSTAAILDNAVAVSINQSTAAILDAGTASRLDPASLPAAYGHGTMVAGLVHRVAPSARILPLKAFRADGSSTTSDIVRAIYYAVNHGASVINLSFSLEAFSDEVMKAVNYATRQGVVCVSSAGNTGKETLVYPAALSNVVSVASSTLADARAEFSNFGIDLVKLAAPGESLVTTYPGGRFAAVSGTSFSTALVAGAAALVIEARRKQPTDYYRALDAFSHAKYVSEDLGYGRLDVEQAVNAARQRIR